jgi:serine/threonine protein kinase/formylglycine-generating enzyme required for sulfatase activity
MTPVPTPPGTPPPTPAGSISNEDTAFRADSAEVFKAGDVIDDRYEVRSVLGKGGMGAVYHVHDRHLGEDCALKAMHPHLLASEKAAERFVQEVRVSRRLSHGNIVRVHGLEKWVGLRYLTMELLDGFTLRDWLKQLQKDRRQVPVETAASIVGQVLDALVYAHRHTIHRDIKPENIFLTGTEPGFGVKLLDFGIAKALDKEALTSTTTSMGTAYYVAPEQLRGEEEVDPRADLYAVGVVLYELLTGRLPTGVFPKPTEVRSELGQEWDRFILGAMDQDPARRPRSAGIMADGLRAVMQARAKPKKEVKEEPKPAPPPKPLPVSGPLQRALQEEEERRAKERKKERSAGKRKAGWVVALTAVSAVVFSGWALREHWLPRPEEEVEPLVQQQPEEVPTGDRSEEARAELRDKAELWVKEAIAEDNPALARQHLGLLESYGASASRVMELEREIDDLERFLAARDEAARQRKEEEDRQAQEEQDRLARQALDEQEKEERGRRMEASRMRVKLLAEATAALDADDLDLARRKVDEYLNAGGSWSEVSNLREKIEKRAIALSLAEQQREIAAVAKKEEKGKEEPVAVAKVSDEVWTPPPVVVPVREHRPGESRTVKIAGTQFRLRWIPPGEDVIGSPVVEACREEDERQWTARFEPGFWDGKEKGAQPQWAVRSSGGFWIGETEVTQNQWRAVMRADPSSFQCTGDCPVESVTWNEVQAFLQRLNEKTSAGAFRLPFEAEWEYAARAGSDGPFNLPCEDFSEKLCDEKVPCLDRIGWYKWNSGGKLHPVAEKQPNAWGLYDMHGNVLEWCQDRCGMYPSGEQTNYMGPGTGEGRVLRGGSWMDQARYVRVANRSCNTPTYRYKLYGFRIVYVEAP